MTPLLAFLAGGAFGALAAWAFFRRAESRAAAESARAEELRVQLETARRDFETLHGKLAAAEQSRSAAEAGAAGAERNLAEQRALLDDAKRALTDAFQALAVEALRGNNTSFVALAEEKFKALRSDAASDLEARRQAVETLVAPLRSSLEALTQEARQLEQKRASETGALGHQLMALQAETSKLAGALSTPRVRGRWGEMALRRTAELAGMTEHCDFSVQVSVPGEDGRLRPDMVVRFPAGRQVVVDAKVSLEAYLQACEATEEAFREEALHRHAAQVKAHVDRLASKEYGSQVPGALDLVVLFIPGDAFLAAAAEKDPGLIEAAFSRKVVIATPTTLITLLRTVALGWREEQVAKGAEEVAQLGQELSDRIAVFVEHLSRVGEGLGGAVKAYDAAVGSLVERVLPQARRFKELGAGGKKDLREPQRIATAPRALTAPAGPAAPPKG